MSHSPEKPKPGHAGRKGSRKRRSRRGNGLDSHKTLARNGINFFALVLGLTAAATLLFLTVSLFRPSNKVPKLQAIPGEKLAGAVEKLNGEEFNQEIESATSDRLREMLVSLNQAASSLAPARQEQEMTRQRRRAVVARKLLDQAGLDSETRFLAIQSRFQALTAIFDLNQTNRLVDPSVSQLLSAAALKYANDADQRIAIAARLVKVRMLVEDNDSTTSLAKELYSLLADFPSDPEVLAMADKVVRFQLTSPDRRENGAQLVKTLLGKSRIEGGETLDQFYLEIDDFQRMLDLEFYSAWEGREFSGQTSYQTLQDVVLDLIETPDAGSVIAKYVTETAYWFEQTNEYEFAIPIYQKMRDQAATFSQSATGQELLKQGTEGLIRCQLPQQLVTLTGTLINNLPLDPDSFKDNSCVIVYWKASDQNSIDALNLIKQDSASWHGKAVQVITVCVDHRSEPSFDLNRIKELSQAYADWTFCIRDAQDQLPLLDMCPSDRVPRIMLLDREQRVVDVDIPISELKTQIGFLLIKQLD